MRLPGYTNDFPNLPFFEIYLPRQAETNKLLAVMEIPFGRFDTSLRYQQVINSNAFDSFPDGGAFITSIYLRPGCGNRNSTQIANLRVRFSHTLHTSDQLDARMDGNLGGDALVVFDKPLVNISSAGSGVCDGPTFPGAFNLAMTLTTPFWYQPGRGSLLLDLVVPEHLPSQRDPLSGYVPPLYGEAVDEPGDETSSLVAIPSSSGTAEIVSTAGLVMLLEAVPFPTLHAFLETQKLLLLFPARPFGLRLQSRGVGPGSVWSDYSGPARVLGGRIDSLNTLYDIPLSSLTTPTLFRLYWNSPQVGLPEVAAPAESSGEGAATQH